MLTLISPSKNLDFKRKLATRKRSEPMFVDRAGELIELLRELDAKELSTLMNINEELSELNVERYADWNSGSKNARPAVLSFRGDVYLGLDAHTFTERDFTSAQRRIRILSGLYGMLRPLDLIHPYRLEMGTPIRNGRGKNLYDFWEGTIADELNAQLSTHRYPVLVNAASGEYFGPASQRKINYPIINCQFLDKYKDDYRFMSYFGKRARGLLARHIVLNRVETRRGLKEFKLNGYYYSPERSTKDTYVFIRDERPAT